MDLSHEQKLRYISQAYNQPFSFIELTADNLTETQIEKWVGRAAIRMADQIVTLLQED